MRGGPRPGAGRPPARYPKRMVSIRLPEWLIQWLKGRNQSKTVEDALVEKHGLKPPED